MKRFVRRNLSLRRLCARRTELTPSFRDAPFARPRNLEIPGSPLWVRARRGPIAPPRNDAGKNHPAALISRSAAALASAVISAPASMRAISSRRWSAASRATRVATRLPLSSASLEINRCWSARVAVGGAWGGVLGDKEMCVGGGGARPHRVPRHHLPFWGDPRQPRADGVGHRTSDPGV